MMGQIKSLKGAVAEINEFIDDKIHGFEEDEAG